MKSNLFGTKRSGERGFTLIELLVVIAVIGILASVILAALSQARDKGKIAKVQQQMAATRAQAELFKSANNGSFVNGTATVCNTNGAATGGIVNMLIASNQVFTPTATTINAAAGTAQATSGTAKATCHANAIQWAASVPITASTGANISFWCVDSSGTSKQEPSTGILTGSGTNQYVCP